VWLYSRGFAGELRHPANGRARREILESHGAEKITTRIMGLLLAAVAIQFMLNAIKVLKVEGF
jgi:MarC family integral membrane protein